MWQVVESEQNHNIIPSVVRLIENMLPTMFWELFKVGDQHIMKWFNLEKGVGNQSLIGPGKDCFVAPAGAPSLLADVVHLRSKYGPC